MHAVLAERQPALQAAQRPDPDHPRRGPGDRHRGARAVGHHQRVDHAGGRVHEHPAPRAGEPRPVPRLLERVPDDRRCPARTRRELAVPAGQGAVARDPDPALRAGHRHPLGGAEDAGRAAPRLVRRALDQLDLRPVRGERPLLLGAAADHRRRGPARGPRVRRHPDPVRAAAAQRHHLPLEPSRVRRGRRPAPPPRGEPRARGRPDGGRHDGQRRVLLRSRAHPGDQRAAAVVADVVLGGRGQLPRRVPDGHRRAGLLARRRAGAGDRAGAAPAAADGPGRPRRLGRPRRGGRAAAGDHRAALPGRAERLVLVRRPGPRPAGRRRRPARGAPRDAARLPRADARQRTRAHLGRQRGHDSQVSPSVSSPRAAAGPAARCGSRRCAGPASRGA